MMSGCQSCSDRLFHSVGPAVVKQQSPNWLRDLLYPQTYKYLSRCRTSYSRWIISCSHR